MLPAAKEAPPVAVVFVPLEELPPCEVAIPAPPLPALAPPVAAPVDEPEHDTELAAKPRMTLSKMEFFIGWTSETRRRA